MILRTKVLVNWQVLQTARRQAQVHNNERENRRRVAWNYQPGQQVPLYSGRNEVAPKLQLHQGPFDVLDCSSTTGTLKIQRGPYEESVSIRRVRPYFQHL